MPTQRNSFVPIGDDAFVSKPPKGCIVITADSFIEDVHFSLDWAKILKSRKEFFSAIGYKSLAVNISDLSAMGWAKPLYCIISLGLPSYISVEDIDNFYTGLKKLADKYNISICGGDTNFAKSFIINITLVGSIKKEKIIKRIGAKNNDKIFVTGNLGDSSAGLEILQTFKKKKYPEKIVKYLIKKHLFPPVRIKESKTISNCATSMIDCSDGLVNSINLLCEASKVGAEVHIDKIPVSTQLKNLSLTNLLTYSLTNYLLYGAEDYELIFTSSSNKLEKKFKCIGEIKNKNRGINFLYNGKKIKIQKEKLIHHF